MINWRGDPWGLTCGCIMAFAAALSFAAARAGIVAGLGPAELILVRFTVAGLALLPLLWRWGLPSLAGVGWPKALVLLVLGGPAFAFLQVSGFAFAPLAHGAIIIPSTVTIFATIMAGLFLRERLSAWHIGGAVLVVVGIILIGGEGVMTAAASGRAWIGDLLFFVSSLLWASFSVMIRHWRLDAVRAVAAVSVLAMIVTIPVYFSLVGPSHFRALPLLPMLLQCLVQGGLQGVIGVMTYSHSIRVLGVSRAVLFPATVPALSILLGIPIVGELPSMIQIYGLILVTIGLVSAIGLVKRIIGRGRQANG